MAHVTTSGIDDFAKQLQKIPTELRAGVVEQVILAGAQKAEEIWKKSIEDNHHVSSRRGKSANSKHMRDSVGHTDIVQDLSGGSTEVYPLDEDSHGVRQATKAYVINYKWDPFVTKQIDKICDNECPKAMQDKFNELMERM